MNEPWASPELDPYGRVICPGCGEFHTHHERVEVYDRGSWSTGSESRVVVDRTVEVSDRVTTDDGNPSDERSAVVIHLGCEHCPERFRIQIVQRKGHTHLLLKLGDGE